MKLIENGDGAFELHVEGDEVFQIHLQPNSLLIEDWSDEAIEVTDIDGFIAGLTALKTKIDHEGKTE